MEKKILLATFEKVAAENGYEVFTPDEIAGYYKDGLQKSLANELTPEEKEVFAADMAFLNKSICVDTDGKEVIRYYRPEQVKWESSEDGLLLKGLAGVYADTPINRKLNRVGEPYIPNIDFMKSLEIEEGYESIIKAARTGRYADTPENRKLHRVGQPYTTREGNGKEDTDKGKGSNVEKVTEKLKQLGQNTKYRRFHVNENEKGLQIFGVSKKISSSKGLEEALSEMGYGNMKVDGSRDSSDYTITFTKIKGGEKTHDKFDEKTIEKQR